MSKMGLMSKILADDCGRQAVLDKWGKRSTGTVQDIKLGTVKTTRLTRWLPLPNSGRNNTTIPFSELAIVPTRQRETVAQNSFRISHEGGRD